MKKLLLSVIALVLVFSIVFSVNTQKAQADVPTLLEFNTMVGVPRPYTGSANPIRGINGGGVPWVLASGHGELSMNGKLEVAVHGLVIDPNDAAAIAAGLAGKNPAAQFKAIVSCQTVDATGAAVVVNVATAPFNATTGLATDGGGNARVKTMVTLPHPCIAPIVFVASTGGSWFASTGN